MAQSLLHQSILAAMALLFLAVPAARAQGVRALDDFADISAWKAESTQGVTVRASAAPGPALRLDYDFAGVSGWAGVHRDLPLDLPENFEIAFQLHGVGAANTLEFKLADASGENVWWRRFPDLEFPAERREITIRKRQIAFAWGPAADHALRHIQSLQFVVSRGKGGGAGSIWIDHLTLRPLPPEPAVPPRVIITRSAAPNADSTLLDLGLVREFGGLTLTWGPGASAARYDVFLSDDGKAWRLARLVDGASGDRQEVRLPGSVARYVRLDPSGFGSTLSSPSGGGGPRSGGGGSRFNARWRPLPPSPASPGLPPGGEESASSVVSTPLGGHPALSDAVVQPPAYGEDPNAFIETIAKAVRPGLYPRAFLGRQTYWTLVGADGGPRTGLISEDGAIELSKGGASVEPFVVDDKGLETWADVAVGQSLKDGYLPIPSVTWRHPDWELKVTSFAAGAAGAPRLIGRYDLRNTTAETRTLTLALAIRPFQVNGPYQTLNLAGGVSAIHDLAWDGAGVRINGEAAVTPLTAPDRFAASSFLAGDAPSDLVADGPTRNAVQDPDGLASGAMIWRLTLPPGGTATVGWTAPLSDEARAPTPETRPASPRAWLDAREDETARAWRSRLDRVGFTVPPEGRELVAALKSAVAQMRMSRDGPMLRPGTRSYDRAWIRDGAMISEALLRMGESAIPAEFLRWYAPRQFADGEVPCCVDDRGADPTAENDSEGELIFLAAEVYRYTRDASALRQAWPHVLAAAAYMDKLRASQRTAGNQTPRRRMLYGLLPPSISHEGYSSKPAWSYWDDFWALRGYDDAVFIAGTLGEEAARARLARSRDEFRGDLLASVRAVAEARHLDYIPGAADLGDFDATSTTIAISPAGLDDSLPKALVAGTFDRFWRDVMGRPNAGDAWESYTPYEWRAVGTFIRLGQRDRAIALSQNYMKDRRPLAWNGWAEVVGRDPRAPGSIGDMPHAWVASDFVRSALDMFAYERDGALVLGAGLPADWFTPGVGVTGLRTPWGALTWSARRRGEKLILTIAGLARPPGGYDFPWPFAGTPGAARADGHALTWKAGVLHLAAPGEVVIDGPPMQPAA